ncbi:MAG: hypothetical protein VX642_08905 [Bdellovibrionota bacterium]|nr:hypothetical protein [Bdellovibrionota bacterium]
MKTLSILVLIFSLNLNAEGVVYSDQKIGDIRITQAGGSTTVTGPNGTVVVRSTNQNSISGTWTKGMSVSLSRVISNSHIPDFIQIYDMRMQMNDGESYAVVSLTIEESESPEAQETIERRAKSICEVSRTHPYLIEYDSDRSWFGGKLIEYSKAESEGGEDVFSVYDPDGWFSGAEYFDYIRCGKFPLNYVK